MDSDDELIARALEILRSRASGSAKPTLTVAELCARFAAAHKSVKSYGVGKRRLRPIIDMFGTRDVMSLRAADWTAYVAVRLETRIRDDRPRCFSKRTINQELGWLKTVAYWGVDQEHIPYNPLAGVKRLKIRKGRQTAPNESEVGRALLACLTPEHVVAVLCGADAGMRRGEILQLRHDWVDTEALVIRLPDWACKNAKGGTIPITRRLAAAIANVPRNIRCPNVLVNPDTEQAYHRNTIDKWWKEIRERAGLEAAPEDGTVHLHDLRAGCASNAMERGVRLETISRAILRHSSLAQTEVYLRGRSDGGDLTAARAAFEAGILRDQERRGPRKTPEDAHPMDRVKREQ